MKALAWPLTVLGIFLALRRPIVVLVPLLAGLRYKDLEFDLGRRLEEVSAQAAALPAGPTSREATPGEDALTRLAESSPRAAILEAKLRLETAALEAARGGARPSRRLTSASRRG